MKNILFVIAALIFASSADAQLIRDIRKGEFAYFRLGEYEFTPWEPVNEKKGGTTYHIGLEDNKECEMLWDFIQSNKKEIENKYHVTITQVYKRWSRKDEYILIEVYDTYTYNKYLNEQENKVAAEKKRKQTRMESLKKIL